MKIIVAKIIKNLFKALLGKKMMFWGLEFAASKTDNLVDDCFVRLGKSAYNNDHEQMIKDAQALIEEVSKLFNDKK
jgi:hypothetical protein